MQVERSGPRTFDEVYALALREQQIFQRCTAQKRQDVPAHNNVRGHESMEIDNSRRGHYYNDHRRMAEGFKRHYRQDEGFSLTDRRNDNQPREWRDSNDKGTLKCWECNGEGHKPVDCPKRLK